MKQCEAYAVPPDILLCFSTFCTGIRSGRFRVLIICKLLAMLCAISFTTMRVWIGIWKIQLLISVRWVSKKHYLHWTECRVTANVWVGRLGSLNPDWLTACLALRLQFCPQSLWAAIGHSHSDSCLGSSHRLPFDPKESTLSQRWGQRVPLQIHNSSSLSLSRRSITNKQKLEKSNKEWEVCL